MLHRLEPSIPFIFEQLAAKTLIPEVESILGRKVDKKEDMYEIILSYFQTVYSPYAIVTSMFNSRHIERNQQAIQETKISKEQFHSFENLLLLKKIL
ncbi:MAG: hypothetical protein HWQ38_08585 [Nostoc sp. NMS7]|uniref:hypothetical protein n=1 Tax=Nostoc sp. NMS7 TaxID=2815391 RepID=UPI0025D18A94|nr:hypothetical protein [Nostoc sp. NMS7]MBN3946539.1 hypothetical protein [Nostoc sp. NMS7]